MALPKWLLEDLGFSDDEQKTLDPLLTPERVTKLEAGHLRQADYSKKMNELNATIETQRTDLTAAQTRLDGEIAEWATLQAAGKTLTDKQRTDYEAAQNDVLRLTQALRRTADQHGLNYDDLVKGIDVKPPVKPDVVPPIDPAKYVDRESFGALTNMALHVPATLQKLQREHFALTGEYFDEEALVAEVQNRAGTRGNKKSLELRDVWEETHDIATKRTDAHKKTHDAEIAAAEQRGHERALSEAALPGGGVAPVGSHAPIFRGERTSVLQRPQPQVASQGAVQALRTGKYRSPTPGSPVAGATGKTA